MLEMKNVTVSYGGAAALRGASTSFLPGEVLVVAGPNGGGKSTLLKAAAGLLPCAEGEVLLDGVSLAALPPRRAARGISYLPQSRSIPDITAFRMVLHGRFPHLRWPRRVRREDEDIAMEALRTADAAELADRSVAELSGGQRQKVYIAMALAQQTDTVLLDEPTTYLDIASQLQVMALARRLAEQGKAVGMVLHDIPMALQCADRLLVLRGGQIAGAGTPGEVFRSGVLDEVFGVRVCRAASEDGWRYYCAGG